MIVSRARQPVSTLEHIDRGIQNLKESRYANKWYFDEVGNLQAEYVQRGDLALVYETKIEQYQGAELNEWWWRSYWVTEIAQCQLTNPLAEVDGAELTSWIDSSQLRKFFTHNNGIHGAQEVSMSNNTH